MVAPARLPRPLRTPALDDGFVTQMGESVAQKESLRPKPRDRHTDGKPISTRSSVLRRLAGRTGPVIVLSGPGAVAALHGDIHRRGVPGGVRFPAGAAQVRRRPLGTTSGDEARARWGATGAPERGFRDATPNAGLTR